MSGNINFNGWLNDDGSENYKCRAWVNFNGTGTVAIRASGGVSSITDGGVGVYTVNFTTAMPDANYSLVYGGGADTSSDIRTRDVWTTTQVKIQTLNGSQTSYLDFDYVCVSIFR